jgi:hypothetical protein
VQARARHAAIPIPDGFLRRSAFRLFKVLDSVVDQKQVGSLPGQRAPDANRHHAALAALN